MQAAVIAFNRDKADKTRLQREEMASVVRDAAADFARRAAARRALIEQGLSEASVPPVALPTAPTIQVRLDEETPFQVTAAFCEEGQSAEEPFEEVL